MTTFYDKGETRVPLTLPIRYHQENLRARYMLLPSRFSRFLYRKARNREKSSDAVYCVRRYILEINLAKSMITSAVRGPP